MCYITIEDLLERQRKGQDHFDSYDTDKADVKRELENLGIRISITRRSGGRGKEPPRLLAFR